MADGFIGRWSQRKLDLKQGRAVPEPDVPVSDVSLKRKPPGATASTFDPTKTAQAATSLQPQSESAPEAQSVQPLTLDDVGALTPESDFKPFVDKAVEPQVRNAAMKKLFTDPHYNVMDGLDIYIDDYSIPSPLPESVLRQMVSAKFLQLFEDEDTPEGEVPKSRDNASSVTLTDAPHPPTSEPHHDDPDLRLQQDHAAGASGSGQSTE
jgi:Protein of unknown function (DUF3306)